MKPVSDNQNHWERSQRSHAPILPYRALTDQDTYICPVCRHGHIHQMALMDAFACDFCRHIFEANFDQQTLRVVDSSQPMLWRWNGKGWRSGRNSSENVIIFLWLVGAFLIVLPVTLVGIAGYVFPPMPGSRWAWVPAAWAILTFVGHMVMVGWLLAEHYQPSLYVLSKIRIRRWLNQNP